MFISQRHYAPQFGLLIIPHYIQYMHNATTSCIRSAWKKSHKFSLISCGYIWNSCVSPMLLYSGGAWPFIIEDLSRLTDNLILRGICYVKLSDQYSIKQLREKLKLRNVKEHMKECCLRWFGHLIRKQEWAMHTSPKSCWAIM